MIIKLRYHLVDESPWLFLVSMASLFLTLGAVLFFHYILNFSDDSFSLCVVSFMSLASKAKPKVLYLGGSILANHAYNQYRQYSFRPIGIGNSHWNPTNYSSETQVMINELLFNMKNKDSNLVYDIMYSVLVNKNGLYSQNYGKVFSVVNNMIYGYNKDNPDKMITEKEFLVRFKFSFESSDLNFLDHTNRGTIMTNISEILAPQVVMKNNEAVLVERCLDLKDKVNLSFQKNPEYSIGLFVRNSSKELTLVIYDSDLKVTEEVSLGQKMNELITNQNSNVTYYQKSNFGMNIVVVASKQKQDSEIVFSPSEINALVTKVKKLAQEYPDHFKNFDANSESFVEFIKTGKASYLNKSNFPVVHHYRPIEFYNLAHDKLKFEESPVYRAVIEQSNKRDSLKTVTPIIENTCDDNN